MFRYGDDYLGTLLAEGPPAARCQWLRPLPSDDFGPRALARRRDDDQAITVRGIAIADAAWQRTSPRLQALAAVEEEHVAALLAYGRHEGLAYFIHAHDDSPRLTTVLHERGGSLPLRVALPVFMQILQAVGDAHRRGVAVGGVRPQDARVVAVIGDVLEIRLRDFGLAAVLGVPAGRRGSTDHPSIYRAPEPDVSASLASDVFSLAVLFIRLLTGPLPAGASEPERRRTLLDRLRWAREAAELSDGLARVIAEGIDSELDARPIDANALRERIVGVASFADVLIGRPPPRPAERFDETHWPARQWTVLDAWERPRGASPTAAAPSRVERATGPMHVVPALEPAASPGPAAIAAGQRPDRGS